MTKNTHTRQDSQSINRRWLQTVMQMQEEHLREKTVPMKGGKIYIWFINGTIKSSKEHTVSQAIIATSEHFSHTVSVISNENTEKATIFEIASKWPFQ